MANFDEEKKFRLSLNNILNVIFIILIYVGYSNLQLNRPFTKIKFNQIKLPQMRGFWHRLKPLWCRKRVVKGNLIKKFLSEFDGINCIKLNFMGKQIYKYFIIINNEKYYKPIINFKWR